MPTGSRIRPMARLHSRPSPAALKILSFPAVFTVESSLSIMRGKTPGAWAKRTGRCGRAWFSPLADLPAKNLRRFQRRSRMALPIGTRPGRWSFSDRPYLRGYRRQIKARHEFSRYQKPKRRRKPKTITRPWPSVMSGCRPMRSMTPSNSSRPSACAAFSAMRISVFLNCAAAPS